MNVADYLKSTIETRFKSMTLLVRFYEAERVNERLLRTRIIYHPLGRGQYI